MSDIKDLETAERLARLESFIGQLQELAIEIEDDDILWITPDSVLEECMQEALRAIVNKVFEANV